MYKYFNKFNKEIINMSPGGSEELTGTSKNYLHNLLIQLRTEKLYELGFGQQKDDNVNFTEPSNTIFGIHPARPKQQGYFDEEEWGKGSAK